jgi:hypothetical protein
MIVIFDEHCRQNGLSDLVARRLLTHDSASYIVTLHCRKNVMEPVGVLSVG